MVTYDGAAASRCTISRQQQGSNYPEGNLADRICYVRGSSAVGSLQGEWVVAAVQCGSVVAALWEWQAWNDVEPTQS